MTKQLKTVALISLITLFGGIIVLDISRKLLILEGNTDMNEAEAEAEAPAEAPVEAPAEAPVEAEAPAEAPVQAPAEAPVQAPAPAPAQKYKKDPAQVVRYTAY